MQTHVVLFSVGVQSQEHVAAAKYDSLALVWLQTILCRGRSGAARLRPHKQRTVNHRDKACALSNLIKRAAELGHSTVRWRWECARGDSAAHQVRAQSLLRGKDDQGFPEWPASCQRFDGAKLCVSSLCFRVPSVRSTDLWICRRSAWK